MKKKLLIATLLVATCQLQAQLLDNLSIGLESNAVWYNDDTKTGKFFDDVNNDSDEHFRSNNYLKLDYTFLKNFTATLQVESYEPLPLLNYSPNFNDTNLGTYSLNYRNEKLDVTAGHYYEQFGNGLIFRSWEDRQLGLNNAMFGGSATYTPMDFLAVSGVYGKQRVGFKITDSEIYGFNTELNISEILSLGESSLNLGLSYIGRYEEIKIENPDFDALTNAFSGRLDYSSNSFYASAEYVFKSEDGIVQFGQISNALVKPGNAFLLNGGIFSKGMGLDLTFRRIENMGFYSEREKAGNVYNENLVNYIPALTRQHDYLLANIYVYQAQPNVAFLDPSLMKAGEIGGQLDFFYTFKKDSSLGGKYGTKIALNGSYWANLKGEYDYDNLDYDLDLFGFGQKYYSEVNLEVRKKWNKKWSSIFFYLNQYYNKKYVEDSQGTVKTNIGVAETTYKMNNGKSIRLEGQHLWTNDDKKSWVGGVFEFFLNSNFSFYINDIYNYGNDEQDARIHYYNLGGSYTKGATRLGINYGRQRGGLLCVGGVCRYVAESTGLSINLTVSL